MRWLVLLFVLSCAPAPEPMTRVEAIQIIYRNWSRSEFYRPYVEFEEKSGCSKGEIMPKGKGYQNKRSSAKPVKRTSKGKRNAGR